MKRIVFTLVFIAETVAAHAQFTITPIKAVAGSYKGTFSYPKVSSARTRAAGKIDSLLQSDILNNEVIETDPKKIFNNTVYIQEPDSLAQSGHTAISYVVLLNNARLFSIKFDCESMGAYPESYTRYYSFDAQSGDVLIAKEMFTAAGLKYLQSHLRSVRAKRIREFLKGEISESEDSAFARERYEECNSVVELDRFVIQKQNVLFHREPCFPHAWRPLDTDLDVPIDYRAIKKYLTNRGKKLLGL